MDDWTIATLLVGLVAWVLIEGLGWALRNSMEDYPYDDDM